MSRKIETLVGKSLVITGDLFISGAIHIDSIVRGNVICKRDVKAKIFLGKDSKIYGNVYGPLISIDGYVDGNVYCYDLLQIGSAAKISGDILYNKVDMEAGAVIHGNLSHDLNINFDDLYNVDVESLDKSNKIIVNNPKN